MQNDSVGMGGISKANNSYDSYYYGKNPWHTSIGMQVPASEKPLSGAELQAAGILNWEAEKVQDVDPRNPSRKLDSFKIFKIVPPEKQSPADQLGGTVQKNYQVVGNNQMLELCQALYGDMFNDGKARLASAGSLFGGSVCFASYHLPEKTIEIAGDITNVFMNVTWGYGGKHGISFAQQTHRVECWNMAMHAYQEALNQEKTGKLGMRLKHSQNVVEKIDGLKKSMQQYMSGIDGLRQRYEALAGKKFTDKEQLAKIICNVYQLKSKSKSDALTEQAKTIIENVSGNYLRNVNNLPDKLVDTYYGVYQAITFQLNHQANTRETERAKAYGLTDEASRRQAAIANPVGVGYKVTNTALNTLCEMVK